MLNTAGQTIPQDLLDELTEVYRQADEICAQNPNADREMIVQILRCLKHPPDVNLGYALFRTGKISPYPDREKVS
ncbi:MAG: hypothetical protein HYU99_00260 [Deltaproteobacteria bacterium]|nr:hypothetical protein [Deltaproteobacteria bacterium]